MSFWTAIVKESKWAKNHMLAIWEPLENETSEKEGGVGGSFPQAQGRWDLTVTWIDVIWKRQQAKMLSKTYLVSVHYKWSVMRTNGLKNASAHSRPVGLKEKRPDSSVNVRCLYSDGELKGGKKKATDPNWTHWKFIRLIDPLWRKENRFYTIWRMVLWGEKGSSERNWWSFPGTRSCFLSLVK